jgi:protein archease
VSPWELIDHTGDVGIRVRAPTLPALLAESARAMYDLLVDAPDASAQREDRIVVEGAGDELLRAWLGELLYRFSVEEAIYVAFDIEIDDRGLRAVARGQKLDRARHSVRTELKAVTYHGLALRRENGGWLGEVIFDI